MRAERSQVLWLGPSPPRHIATEFTRRHLTLTAVGWKLSQVDLKVSCAAIFCFDEKRKGQSIGLLKEYAEVAANHGLLIIVHASRQDTIRLLQAHLTTFPEVPAKFIDFPRPTKHFSMNKPAHELAELAARHPSGPGINLELKIKGSQVEKPEDAFLLRRAFSDCAAISLEPLKKGFSGARVFAVYAEFPEGEAAPYPLPYFAKIDSCKRILKEYEAYERFVSRYIPFSQRPNCELKRSFLGLNQGILVGDFVDNSVSLATLVQPNGARSVIHSLFDDALRGWRQQAYDRNDRISFSEIRASIMVPNRIKQEYVAAALTFGASLSPLELTRILDGSVKHLYRKGPVHGDLNTENIRVRNGEAILIDFYKSTVGPLVADLASLEIAICFAMEAESSWDPKAHGRYEDSEQFKEWRRHIDKLFVFVANEFSRVSPLQEQPCAHNWMWSACRQLRLMAHYIEPSEEAYGYVLAAYLLRMAMFSGDGKIIVPHTPDAVVRSYAYWSAERILRAIGSREEAA